MEYKRQGGSIVGRDVGYTDFQIGKNKYKVTYAGSINQVLSDVMEMAYWSASELCMENGFDDHVVTNTESSDKDLGKGLMASSLNNDMQSMRTYSLDIEWTSSGKGNYQYNLSW